MKKAFVLIIMMVVLLAMANVAYAAERNVISLKVGYNASGAEIERIKNNGISYFLNGAAYGPYTTLVGMRKHTSLYGSHPYFGVGVGLTYFHPTVDGHVGYEFHPEFLPDFLNARAEAGVSAVIGWVGLFRPVIHFGVGVSYDFDWSIFNF